MKLEVVAHGEGPLVVLVHGAMDRSNTFRQVVRHIEDRRTVIYDRRGYGRSPRWEATEEPALAVHAADLVGIIEREGGPATVAGHSFGGLVALAAAQQRPELFRALALFEAPMPWLDWWPTRTAGAAAAASEDPRLAAEVFLRRLIGDERWEAMPEPAKEDRRDEGAALVAEITDAHRRPPFDASEIKVPCVVGRGTRSPEHMAEGAERLAAMLGAALVTIDGASHGAHISHPAEFARFVLDAESGAGGSPG